jgi:hypothetical protein
MASEIWNIVEYISGRTGPYFSKPLTQKSDLSKQQTLLNKRSRLSYYPHSPPTHLNISPKVDIPQEDFHSDSHFAFGIKLPNLYTRTTPSMQCNAFFLHAIPCINSTLQGPSPPPLLNPHFQKILRGFLRDKKKQVPISRRLAQNAQVLSF